MQSYRAFCEGLGLDARDVLDARRMMDEKESQDAGEQRPSPDGAPAADLSGADDAESEESVEELEYGAFSAKDGASDDGSGDEGPAYVPTAITRASGGDSVPEGAGTMGEQAGFLDAEAGPRSEGAESPTPGDADTSVEQFRLDPDFDYENAPIEERAMPSGYAAATALATSDDQS